MKYLIAYGLGGGFGGVGEWEEIEEEDLDAAEKYAYECACEEYESYVGLHGLRTVEEIMNEEDLDEDRATEEFYQERDSWIDYQVKEL